MKHCNKIKLVIILFLTILPIWKINAQDVEADDNDNWKYFYDIAVESGTYVSAPLSRDNFIVTLSGSYYWSSKYGVRSGISLITEANSNAKYIKVPVLLAFRTRTFTGGFDPDYDYDNFGSTLAHFILSLLPTRFEFNIGISLGYITPETYSAYTTVNGEKVMFESLNIHNPFAASLDANGRISFQFWRICVNGNLGINYLFTKNYNYRLYSPNEERYRPPWFINASLGFAFRF